MIRALCAMLLVALAASTAQMLTSATRAVFDPQDVRIRGFVTFLERRNIKIVSVPSAKAGTWRITEPNSPGEARFRICGFAASATEAQMRAALEDSSGDWRHFNVPAGLAMSRLATKDNERVDRDKLGVLEERLRHAFFWYQREHGMLKNRLTNEVADAGLDPRDERIGALVAYLGRNGIKLTHGEWGWRIVEPKHDDGWLTVSIRSFPPPASEEQMRYALDVNLYYELNVEAQIAMSLIGFVDSKKGQSPAGLQEKLQRLFHDYRPAGAPSSAKAAQAQDEAVRLLKARGIELQPAPNSTNVIQRMYSIGPDHDNRFYVGLSYVPPGTDEAFRKAHRDDPFPYEIRDELALFKVGGPNGNDGKEYRQTWSKVLSAFRSR